MSIVTKTGDEGETSLMYGRRVSKTAPRVEAYGSVDELNAALGLARAVCEDRFVLDQIFAAQKDLIIVMGELATAQDDRERYVKDGFHITDEVMVDRVTAVIVDLEKDETLYPKDWVIPGETATSAALDFARTTCRRAERRVSGVMSNSQDFNGEIVRYLNRLSDLCWILARVVERNSKSEIRNPKSAIS